jgi:DNA-binding XRE family transcriptional regulator
VTPAEKMAADKAKRPTATSRKRVWVCTVRSVRESLGLSLRDVERGCGVSNATICQVEAGCDVTLRHARALATFFGVSIESLWPKRA